MTSEEPITGIHRISYKKEHSNTPIYTLIATEENQNPAGTELAAALLEHNSYDTVFTELPNGYIEDDRFGTALNNAYEDSNGPLLFNIHNDYLSKRHKTPGEYIEDNHEETNLILASAPQPLGTGKWNSIKQVLENSSSTLLTIDIHYTTPAVDPGIYEPAEVKNHLTGNTDAQLVYLADPREPATHQLDTSTTPSPIS